MIADTLREAKALVERGWCQKHFAEDAEGLPADPMNDNAVRFCGLGALERAARVSCGAYASAKVFLTSAVGECVPVWQDRPERTKADVLAAYDRAIALAEQEGA